MTAPVLEARGLVKHWGGTTALRGVSLALHAGSVHALLGRNGAGKSTLLGVLAGLVTPDAGEVLLEGRPVRLRSPSEALAHGIATVHQELSIIPELTVAENVLLGHQPRRPRLPFLLDHAATRRHAAKILDELGVSLDPAARAGGLSFAARQVVEIARALARSPRVLLLDEPTSGLSSAEVRGLERTVKALRARGVAVAFVTHRLDEVPRLADEVSVLRDAELVATIPGTDATPARLVGLMFGETSPAAPDPAGRPAVPGEGAEPALRVRGLRDGGRLRGVDLEVRTGEIVGLAGVTGSGRTEVLHAVFGARSAEGDVRVSGEEFSRRTPHRAVARGLALVPEDRKGQGLAAALPILDNACHPSLAAIARGGFLTRWRMRAAVEPVLARVELQARGVQLERAASTLSGGNQQKVVVGKWLVEPRRLLLLDEPTKGIDLASRRQVFEVVRRLAGEGLAVLVVSSELDELIELCHRILVLREGRITAEVAPESTSLAGLHSLAMGA